MLQGQIRSRYLAIQGPPQILLSKDAWRITASTLEFLGRSVRAAPPMRQKLELLEKNGETLPIEESDEVRSRIGKSLVLPDTRNLGRRKQIFSIRD